MNILSLRGPEAKPFIEDLGRLRIKIFREFPYLYDGDLAYERSYLSGYFACPDSLVVLVQDQGRIVGAATGLPLLAASKEWQAPFVAQGIPVQQVFYFGESLLDSDYRGCGIGHKFFDLREQFAMQLAGIRLTAFCAVARDQHHPRRPAEYRSHDAFWEKRGYRKVPGLISHFSWQDLDESAVSPKPMEFWMREHRPDRMECASRHSP